MLLQVLDHGYVKEISVAPMFRCSILFLVWKVHKYVQLRPFTTVKVLNIGRCMSEQAVWILISLIGIFIVCQSFYIFWKHCFIVKLNCFILRTTAVAGLGVPIFGVFTVLLS